MEVGGCSQPLFCPWGPAPALPAPRRARPGASAGRSAAGSRTRSHPDKLLLAPASRRHACSLYPAEVLMPHGADIHYTHTANSLCTPNEMPASPAGSRGLAASLVWRPLPPYPAVTFSRWDTTFPQRAHWGFIVAVPGGGGWAAAAAAGAPRSRCDIPGEPPHRLGAGGRAAGGRARGRGRAGGGAGRRRRRG